MPEDNVHARLIKKTAIMTILEVFVYKQIYHYIIINYTLICYVLIIYSYGLFLLR